MYTPSKEEFIKLSNKGNLIPVYREVLADLETPVSAYFKISKGAKYSFLLESVEGGEKIARYSFLAKDPQLIFRTKNSQAEIISFKDGHEHQEKKQISDTPLTLIRDILKDYEIIETPGLPRFCGGMVGYLGYDVVRFFEKLPRKTIDDLNIPDIELILCKSLVIFDHINHKIKVVACVEYDSKSSPQEKIHQYEKAIKVIDQLVLELGQPLDHALTSIEKTEEVEAKSNTSEQEFTTMVKKAKERIKDGDIIQVVLSQRFEVTVKTNPFHIYRTLRGLNPSPYMFYLNFDETKIIGSSPELLVRSEEGVVETRPIAGTRPRGKNDQEDERLKKDLLSDPKEKAEHIMLVDLGRNDLGRVCQKGSVVVSEFMGIEKYSHVMHIISNITGRLKKGCDALDVLQAAFPAGTVSGAPKIRAMEIIEELEKVTRGPYAGAIGYFSFSKNLDSCITIRTIVVKNGTAYVQAGAGIVADSVAAKEYQETLNKARAQIMAIKLAHNSF